MPENNSHRNCHRDATQWAIDMAMKRVDLHCHSQASTEADEAALVAIQCPESFSSSIEVYDQAKRRGMDLVTITDHDSIAGVSELLTRPDVLSGEEVTCYFPEDRCKIHLLVWGLNADDHNAMQAVANDIYKVAAVVEERRLAHSVAHPLYRQNDVLEKWHLERLILMFKGFETLNGAHSILHRDAVEPMVNALTPESIAEMAALHGMAPRWPDPHIKARTGGSDDHGLFNIGRTWTEFPGSVSSIEEVLECLRQGNCRPGGEAGSSLKLAHNFFGVGIRYYGRKMRGSTKQTTHSRLVLDSLIGERKPMRKRDWLKLAVRHKAKKLGHRLIRPFHKPAEPTGAALLGKLFTESAALRMGDHQALEKAVRGGCAALGEHAAMFDFVSDLNRDIVAGIAQSIRASVGRGELNGIFDSVATVVAHQFLQMPYYFAMFHQNRERHLLSRLTGRRSELTVQNMKLGVFTDTFDEINGVARFVGDISRQASGCGRKLVVHTCTAKERISSPARKNFKPLLSGAMPAYPDQPWSIPPLAEVLEWADRQQFDAIHVHTPGPMGLCGYVVAKMLRVPLLGTYHTDFPRYVGDILGDHRLTVASAAYMKWFYGQTSLTFSRSREYIGKLKELGLAEGKLTMTLPGVDTEKFSPAKRDLSIWTRLGISHPHKLLYAGRVSVEKNLPLLVEVFRRLCQQRNDTALVIAGDGPYRAKMQQAVKGLPVHFLGYQNDEQLSALYASSDLFVFPSRTDTLGQAVVEAQASGLPVLVSDAGGPKEMMDDQITGVVVNSNDAAAWHDAIDALLEETPRRMRMSRTAPHRVGRFSLRNMFEAFWAEHLKLVNQQANDVAVAPVQARRAQAVGV